MNNNSEYKIKKKAALISLLIGFGMFFFKTFAYLLTNSSAIFSDALESVVHILATSMAFYSIILSAKPADKSHLYGHGKIEFFSAGVEGILIIVAAIGIIYSAIDNMVKGVELQQLDIGAGIIAFAGFINLALGFYLVRTGKKTNSLTLVADGKHVLTDSYTSIGVLFGILLVIITGIVVLDPIIAIIIAFNILTTGYKLIRESVRGLMQETDDELLYKIVSGLGKARKSYWIDVHHLKFWKSGDELIVEMHLILPHYFTVRDSHHEEEAIQDILKTINPNVFLTVHMDYCKPEVCKYCEYENCKERLESKSINFSWDAEKLLGDPVYF
ncbi:MAG TPA: cation diffusion facilitator family transporter [Ignavibacteriales bacterium]|nr:cation diffusion facilitator family transporter [Ignavibacteriales bacterium]